MYKDKIKKRNLKNIGILVLATQRGGGVYQYSQSVVDALKDDSSNRYIIFCYDEDERFDGSGLEVRKIKKTKYHIIKRNIIECLLFLNPSYFYKKKYLNIFEDIDCFFSPSITAFPHFFLKKPFIFTLHDMQEKYYPNFFTFYERYRRNLITRYLANSAQSIICESEYVKNDIVRFIGINPDKIMIIQSPPPHDFLRFNEDKNKYNIIRKKYGLPDKFIFYPANSWYHKNHLKLIDAFEKVHNNINEISLVLSGAKRNNQIYIDRKIKEKGLCDNVFHLGYIDYLDLPYIYKMAEMLVMPSLFESISIPVFEAFSLHVPVCCSNVVGLPDQIGDAGLLFDPNDENDMANKIMMYLFNKKLRLEKANKGYEKIINFNVDHYQKTLRGLFQCNSVLEKK